MGFAFFERGVWVCENSSLETILALEVIMKMDNGFPGCSVIVLVAFILIFVIKI